MPVAPASASSSSSSSMSSDSSLAKYEVFLNFRGEDTREKFLSHLHAKLIQKNIKTYIDYKIPKGGNISKELIEAIQGSKISLIIFSEKYAFSSWCLEEVVCILKCKKEHGQTIVPVFYDIEPSLVRRQLDRGQPAFEKHIKEKAAGKVEEWKNALIEAASISGWDSQTYNGTEAEFVEDIAKDILVKLNEMYSSSNEFKGLVGIDKNIVEMRQLLCIGDSTTVRMIGIWGMGGLGKTTLARVLFKQLSSEFESCCFLANVREESGKRDGLESLEKKLLSELLEENDLKTITHFEREKLPCKKVLIVFDDVDNPEQLEVLAPDHDRFGPGSRVILTTRDAQVLRDRVDEKYELKKLGSDDSLQLFIAHAFKSNYTPTAEDVILSKRVVNYADGNPLALEVLGPFLRSKRKETWETELEKLKKFPNERIHNVLRVSFDGLDKTEKAIFLDIACLFRIGLATCRKYVERILSVHRSYVNIGIDCLIEKSLITVKDHSNLAIHDLLREMGWEIERQQCERTRLWDEEELYDVFTTNTGTPNAVQGISCFIGWERRDWSLQGMHRLWLLHIPDIFSGFPQCLQYLPDSLKCLIINYCPWKSLPSHFMAPNLVELRMPRSKLEKLWSGDPNLGKLKYVDLSRSSYLTEISALSQASNLVSVDLSFCESLHQVPPLRFGIGDKLTFLDQSHNNCYCNECQTLGQLKLDYCIRLKVVERISGNLKELHLSNSTSIEDLSSSICTLYDLEYLNLCNCRRLKSLPSDMQMLKSLTRLDLKGCSSFDKLPVLPRSLIELDLAGTSIEEVPSSSIEHLFGQEKLTLQGCERLKSLPSDMQMLKSLTHLDLKGCSSFDKLPVLPRSLIELDLTGTSIKEVPSSSIEHLFGLVKLTLYGCKSLKSLPTGICKLKSLEELELTHCNNLEILPAIKNLSKLIALLISNCKMLKSLPELPLSLELLDASGCTSLGRIANSRDALLQWLRNGNHVITSTEFFYVDCLNLDQNMCSNIVSEFQLRTLHMSTKSIQPHVGLNTSDCPCVCICFPGNKIPMWFTHQSESAAIKIKLSPYWKNTKFLGFAFCVVVANEEMPSYLWCDANFKTNNGESYNCSWVLYGNDRTANFNLNSSNLFMWYKPEHYHNCLDIAEVSFCFSAGDMEDEVRACGVRPLYLQDAKELGITNELGKSNAISTGAVTCTSVEPQLKRIKTSTSDSK